MIAMNDDLNRPSVGLALPRCLALILFALAALIGLPTLLASAGGLMERDWRALVVLGGVGALVRMLVWLGMRIWSGRSIPGWFLAAFGAVIVVTPAALLVAKGQWVEGLVLLVACVPMIMQVRAASLSPATKTGLSDDFLDSR